MEADFASLCTYLSSRRHFLLSGLPDGHPVLQLTDFNRLQASAKSVFNRLNYTDGGNQYIVVRAFQRMLETSWRTRRKEL
jgi:hypothetical protein